MASQRKGQTGRGFMKRVGWKGLSFQASLYTPWLECKFLVGMSGPSTSSSHSSQLDTQSRYVDHNSNTIFQKPNLGHC